MPGQPDNANAAKHGLTVWDKRHRIPQGIPGRRAILRQLDDKRAELLAMFEETHGRPPSGFELDRLRTAERHFGRMLLANSWLYRECESMTLDQRLAVLARMEKSDAAYDSVLLKGLKLTSPDDQDEWKKFWRGEAEFYGQPKIVIEHKPEEQNEVQS